MGKPSHEESAAAFAHKNVYDMYHAVTRVIRSSKQDSGACLFKPGLTAALNEYFQEFGAPQLLRGIFSSLSDQAHFLFSNTSSRRCAALADVANDVMEKGRLRPITYTGGCFRIDMLASTYSSYVEDECAPAANQYRPSAIRFCEGAKKVLDTEGRIARTQHERIAAVLKHYQCSPRFYVNKGVSPLSANHGGFWCVVSGLGPLAVDILPLYSAIVVLISNTNQRLSVNIKYVDGGRNLHCTTRNFVSLVIVEQFHNKDVVVEQHDFENLSGPRREALECLTWRQRMYTMGFARCLVGEPVSDSRPLPLRPHTGLSSFRCKEDAAVAIQASVENNDGLTILTGGPGSGKTATAALFASQYANPPDPSMRRRRVLYMAPSNAAVDAAYLALGRAFGNCPETVVLVRACSKQERKRVPTDPLDIRHRVLARHISLFHAQSRSSIFATFKPHQVAGLQRGFIDPCIRAAWQERIRARLNTEAAEMVASASVVCCTIDMARSTAILRQAGTFDVVIGDEAGQASDAQLSLLATVPGVASGLLVGDDKQLGPFGNCEGGDGKSPFMALVERATAGLAGRCLNLTTVYRCHPFAVSIFNRLFYGGILQCGVSANDRMPGLNAVYINPKANKPVLWMNQRSEEFPVGTSFQSSGEASTVVLLLEALTVGTAGICPQNICVLAPYVAQVGLLLESVGNMFPGISILTIDSAQGATYDYVILSLVRSNFRCDTGFVGDPRRLNVMLSRARLGLFIVGCHRTALGSRRRDGAPTHLSRLARICMQEDVVCSHLAPFWRARYNSLD
jgi:AAA domain